MKKSRVLVSVLLVLVMALAMSVTVFAEGVCPYCHGVGSFQYVEDGKVVVVNCMNCHGTGIAPDGPGPAPEPAGTSFIEPIYHADYEDTAVYVSTNQAVICRALNVRPVAGTSKAPLAVIHRGDAVKVIEIADGWAKIVWGDGEAYVCAKYIA